MIGDIEIAFPTSATRHRRDHAKVLSVISALTLLHQHQRELKSVAVNGHEVAYLEATPDDVEVGLDLANGALSRRLGHLAPQTARLLEVVAKNAEAKASKLGCAPFEVAVTRRELREMTGWSDKQVRAGTDRLVALEYLVVSGGGRGRCRTYAYVPEIAPVGPKLAPVRPDEGRTSHPASPGEMTEFAQLAQLPASHAGGGDQSPASYTEIAGGRPS